MHKQAAERDVPFLTQREVVGETNGDISYNPGDVWLFDRSIVSSAYHIALSDQLPV